MLVNKGKKKGRGRKRKKPGPESGPPADGGRNKKVNEPPGLQM
jgi:hypothetical protein